MRFFCANYSERSWVSLSYHWLAFVPCQSTGAMQIRSCRRSAYTCFLKAFRHVSPRCCCAADCHSCQHHHHRGPQSGVSLPECVLLGPFATNYPHTVNNLFVCIDHNAAEKHRCKVIDTYCRFCAVTTGESTEASTGRRDSGAGIRKQGIFSGFHRS